ncbi:MAG: carboxypeptidase regulatory-like domain-containing protein [Chloroflexota bacterium]|nr:carboxypeptidase regulatory-like domain-containing protein [Chloroflexota bacterium]
MTFAHRLLSLLLLAVLLAACGGSSRTTPAATAPSQANNQQASSATTQPAAQPTEAATAPAVATEVPQTDGTAPAPAESTALATTEPEPAQATVQPVATQVPEATEAPQNETGGAAAPAEGAAYTGTVLSHTGKPLAKAMVYAGNSMVRTDARGRYRVQASPGAQELTVMAPGYRKHTAKLGEGNGNVRLEPFVAKGVYVSGIGDDDVRERFYGLMEDTELNAMVINVKNDDGRVFTSKVPLARETGASFEDFHLRDVVADAHKRGIYVIGRFTTFRDPNLATERPDLAIQNQAGKVWEDNQGHRWVDPFRREVWDYFGDLLEEIAESGIDEIQFDYVRFPVDGDLSSVKYKTPSTRVNRPQTISSFLKYAEGRLRPHKVFISADTYGLTVVSDNEQGTGQIVQRLAPYLDYYSPMIYPDHFAAGSFGFQIPSAHPYEVIYRSVKQAQAKLKGTPVLVRPYLSAFRDTQFGQPFGLPQFLAQKRGAEEAGAHSWIYWDAALKYPDELFRAE